MTYANFGFGALVHSAYSCPRKFASADLDPDQCLPAGVKPL
jgi:hypothetical protein